MSGGANTLARLQRLQAEGSLARTSCARVFLHALAPLLSAGVIIEERSGAGRRLVVRQPAALAAFIEREFPGAGLAETDLSRTAGVAQFRNSKIFPSDTPEIVSLRAWSESAVRKNGEPCAAAAATAAHGVFSLLLNQTEEYSLCAPVALVENPAVFAHFERLGMPVQAAIYGHGRISRRLADWLARQTAPRFALVHCPDFDPAGLVEYERLCAGLGERISLFLPPDLEEKFRRFSNRALLQKKHTQGMLATLRRSLRPEVRRVVALIDEHNAGLEQEALLLQS